VTRASSRVTLTPAYVLHARDYRETGRILELFSADHGRLTAFARGVRGAKARLAPLLQPFTRLLVSWSGRGEAVQLVTAERGPAAAEDASLPVVSLPAAALLPAWYLNELLLKLTTRHDPLPDTFADYERTLAALAAVASEVGVLHALRRFEKRLLDQLGYGADFSCEAESGESIEPNRLYRFRPGVGFVRAASETSSGAVLGAAVLAVAAEDFAAPGAADCARAVARDTIDRLLDGRVLSTREVARALARSRPDAASVAESDARCEVPVGGAA
jgi:DNA repair protein RecO (recombination protein O)